MIRATLRSARWGALYRFVVEQCVSQTGALVVGEFVHLLALLPLLLRQVHAAAKGPNVSDTNSHPALKSKLAQGPGRKAGHPVSRFLLKTKTNSLTEPNVCKGQQTTRFSQAKVEAIICMHLVVRNTREAREQRCVAESGLSPEGDVGDEQDKHDQGNPGLKR